MHMMSQNPITLNARSSGVWWLGFRVYVPKALLHPDWKPGLGFRGLADRGLGFRGFRVLKL